MTIQEMISNHRDLWNWVADETEKQKRCVTKDEYFFEFGPMFDLEPVLCDCYACEVALRETRRTLNNPTALTVDCDYCPFIWTDESDCVVPYCSSIGAFYERWLYSVSHFDHINAVRYARMIADMQLKECYKYEGGVEN